MNDFVCEYCQPVSLEFERLHDKEIHNEEAITWYPWVGVDYKEGGLLVIGESNYADGDMGETPEKACKALEDNVNFTREMVRLFIINRDKANKTFTGISNVLCDNSLLSSNMVVIGRSVWKRIAYMDVIQTAMQGLPEEGVPTPPAWANCKKRQRPKEKKLWTNGWRAVLKVIKVLKPNSILFVGSGVADHCNPKFLPHGNNSVMHKERIENAWPLWREGELKLQDGRSIKFGAIPNPGSQGGFNYRVWRDKVSNVAK